MKNNLLRDDKKDTTDRSILYCAVLETAELFILDVIKMSRLDASILKKADILLNKIRTMIRESASAPIEIHPGEIFSILQEMKILNCDIMKITPVKSSSDSNKLKGLNSKCCLVERYLGDIRRLS